MLVNIIPDVHGEIKWKELINLSCDKIIFLGDYVDSFTITNEQIINNLNEIITLKKEYLDKVILLWGNHDLMYYHINDLDFRCSGFRPEIGLTLHEIFSNNNKLFQYAHQINNYIFTHAGIQNNWFTTKFKGNINKNIADQLNNPIDRDQFKALHQVGYRRGGYSDVGGIVWCDKNELTKPLKNYNQIVGHTRTNEVKEFIFSSDKLNKFNSKNTVYFCDCLDSLLKPLIFKIND